MLWRTGSNQLRNHVAGLVLAVSTLVGGSLAASCGVIPNTETSLRDYTIHATGAGEREHRQFETLVNDFNASTGYLILSYTRDANAASSPLSLIAGLEARTGKLGFGGVVVVTKRSGLQSTRTEAMQIELDQSYVAARLTSIPGQEKYDELRLLFFHEIGHGFGFDHATSKSDVMYADLAGTKDFASFFLKVRNFIESDETTQ
jgi:hypothetical protein